MRKRLLFVSLVLFWSSIALGQQDDSYTVYDIQAELDPHTHTLSGKQSVAYTNRSDRPLQEIYFVLSANHSSEKNPYIHDIENDRGFWNGWEPKSTTIQFVKDVKGSALEYSFEAVPAIFQKFSLDKVLLKVVLPQALPPGERKIIDMGFNTFFVEHKFGDEAHWQGFYTWRFGWNPIELSMKGGEWFSEGFRMVPAHYRLTLRIPNSFVVGAGAGKRTLMSDKDGTKTWFFESEVPQLSIPLTMGSDYDQIEVPYKDGKIVSLYRGDHIDVAKMMYELAREIIDFYEPRFGEYRHRDLVIAEASAPLTAMASDGLVLMMETVYKYKDLLVPGALNRLLEYVLAHEIAHLWWGVGITQDFAQENWLSEAFANYLAYVYMEEKYGIEQNVFEYQKGGFLSALIRFFVGDQSFHRRSEATYLNIVRLGWDEEIAKDPRDIQFGNATGPRTYEKGYWVINALENEIGREQLFLVLKKAFTQYQGKILTIREFQKLCEEQHGKPLDWFFDQWVFGVASLDYSVDDVESERSDNKYHTRVTINKTGSAIANTQVALTTESGKQFFRDIPAGKNQHVVEIETETEIELVQVDPRQKLPDTYRIDNTWPTKVKYHFGLYDDPLDAYSVRYNILPSGVLVPATGDINVGFAIGLSGGYSPTHQWSLDSSVGFKDRRSYFSNIGTFNYLYNAKNQYFAVVDATGYDQQGFDQSTYRFQVGHQHTLFETPNLGASSRILLPSNTFVNTLVLRDYEGWYRHPDSIDYFDEYEGPIASWRFTYGRDDSVRYAWQNQFTIDFAPPTINDSSFYTTQLSSTKRIRLIPNWVLSIRGVLNYASTETPVLEKYRFDQMKTIAPDDYVRTRALLRADIDFPLLRELEGTVLNIVSLKSIRGNLFTTGTALGDKLYDIKTARLVDDESVMQLAESGAAIKLIFTTLAGFVDINLDIGYAVPWYFNNTSDDARQGIFLNLGFYSAI